MCVIDVKVMFNLQTSTTMKLLPLVCLCLLTWSGGTFGDQHEVITVEEGSDVILPCSLSTSENIESKLFDWKKDGQKKVFLYNSGIHSKNSPSGQDVQFTGRVSHFRDELKHGNASIIIINTKVADRGNYTCDFPLLPTERKVHIQLVVGAASKPSVMILGQTEEGMLLQCDVRRASPKPKVEWWDSAGNILPAKEPQVSERGGIYDITLQTNVTKTDRYRCVATQEDIKHQIYAETYVPVNGAASKPSVKILDETKDWALLQCEVQGASPKPQLQWQDSAGNILPAKEPQVSERGGSYDVILQTTVTKTDRYRCVATQEDINHQTDAETYVRINESSTGLIVAAVVAAVVSTLLVVGVIVAVLYCKGVIKLSCNKDSSRDKSDQTAGKEMEPLSK